MQLASTRGRLRVIDWKPFLALLAAIGTIGGAWALIYRAARGLSKREEAVELVPTLKTSVEGLADKIDALTAKVDNVASATIVVPTLKETLADQGHKLDTATKTLERLERNQERLSDDVRAVEVNITAVQVDVAEVRGDVNWLKKKANGVHHPGEGGH